jgi:hypothetical protein
MRPRVRVVRCMTLAEYLGFAVMVHRKSKFVTKGGMVIRNDLAGR